MFHVSKFWGLSCCRISISQLTRELIAYTDLPFAQLWDDWNKRSLGGSVSRANTGPLTVFIRTTDFLIVVYRLRDSDTEQRAEEDTDQDGVENTHDCCCTLAGLI